ncbi:MAG: hypothetical protein ACLQU5_00285 [Isosphaeraceae bacterium]
MRATGFCVIHAIAVMGVSWAARGVNLRRRNRPESRQPARGHRRLVHQDPG